MGGIVQCGEKFNTGTANFLGSTPLFLTGNRFSMVATGEYRCCK